MNEMIKGINPSLQCSSGAPIREVLFLAFSCFTSHLFRNKLRKNNRIFKRILFTIRRKTYSNVWIVKRPAYYQLASKLLTIRKSNKRSSFEEKLCILLNSRFKCPLDIPLTTELFRSKLHCCKGAGNGNERDNG